MNEDINNTQAALHAGMALGEPHELATNLFSKVIPDGAKIELVDTQKFEENPRRKTGARSLATADSFIRYVNAHKVDATSIYADKEHVRFAAVFNDHEPETRMPEAAPDGQIRTEPEPSTAGSDTASTQSGEVKELVGMLKTTHSIMLQMLGGRPGWGDFTATYACPVSVEWKRWHGNSQHGDVKKPMSHETFIQFIEDNLLDIIKPENGAMLGMVRSFEAKKDVKFASAVRLDNGDVSFKYSEETAGVPPQEGKLMLPEMFTILIPVFDGGAKYELDAKLRYRITGGGLLLWYELVRPHKTLEHAFNTVLEEIKAGTDAVPLYSV